MPVSVKIPGSDIELAQKGRRGKHAPRFHRPGEGRERHAARHGPRRDHGQAEGRDRGPTVEAQLAYDTGFTLQPGTYTLKFLARENETGKMGTFETKFVVPDLTADPKYLPISSVVLSYQREKLEPAVAGGEETRS